MPMWDSIQRLDRLLRGEATNPGALRDGTIDVPLRGLTVVILLLAMFYGACMGSFSLFRGFPGTSIWWEERFFQWLATTIKVPLLFLLTLIVTFPSLYVFNAMVGSRLDLRSVFCLLISSLGVNLAVLASLGTIVAFFSVSTKSYHFMVLFNVLTFAVAGFLGLAFLLQTLNRLTLTRESQSPRRSAAEPAPHSAEIVDLAAAELVETENQAELGPLETVEGHVLGRHVGLVFRCWVVVFGLVGAQMGWVLRPFIGDPSKPFQWFRQRESNFFEAVYESVAALFTISS